MNKVLHAALKAPHGYTHEGMMKGFLAAGFTEYRLFDYQLESFQHDRGKEGMRERLIQMAEQMKPDLIFLQIQMSDWLDLETFKRLSKIAFTVNYTFDIRSVEQTEWLYEVTRHIGLMCFSNQRDVNECYKRGIKNAMCLQSSVDMDVYKPAYLDPADEFTMRAEGDNKDVVFIGNNFMNTNHEFPLSVERDIMVRHLQSEFPGQFEVFGNNWDGSKLIPPKQEIEIYRRSIISIAHNNFNEESYTSDRIWRIMATGSFCLTKYFKGIEKLFTRYVHLDWWESIQELRNAITYYLSNPARVDLISATGTKHVRENHTWAARVSEMMLKVNSLRGVKPERPCLEAHVIDGVIPEPHDQKFDGRVCDCGRLRGAWKECGCVLKEWKFMWEQNI